VSFDRPVRLALSAALNQKPVSAEGRFGPVGRNPGLDPVPLEFTVDAFGLLKLNVTGTLENLLGEPLARIDAEAAEFSPRRLLAEIGQPLPPTADPTVLERASFKASMRAGTQAVTVSDAVLNLDDSKLVFSVKVTEFSKPGLAFDLNLDRIDIDRYLAPQSTPAEQKAGPSRPKTDYTPLRKLVLDGNARIGRLTVARAQAEDVNLEIAAREGILAIDPISMKLYRGTAVGKTAVNFKGERPATEVEVQLDNVQVNPLLKDILDEDFLEGAAQTRLALSARGEDPARIKQSLNGKGSLTLSDGAIVGVDLAAMVRNLKATLGGKVRTGAKPRTDFSELIVPFTIENGVFHTPETLLKSPLMRLQATGKADLVRETLDFRVDPKLVGTIKGQGDEKERAGLGVPLIVSGTFASPIVGPDVAALAQDRLKKALGPSAPVKEKTSELIRSLQPGKK
jgi:AsmA protein